VARPIDKRASGATACVVEFFNAAAKKYTKLAEAHVGVKIRIEMGELNPSGQWDLKHTHPKGGGIVAAEAFDDETGSNRVVIAPAFIKECLEAKGGFNSPPLCDGFPSNDLEMFLLDLLPTIDAVP